MARDNNKLDAYHMATSRAIKGVLDNFLGTFTSRYSDFDGYWLFGFLVSELAEIKVDLQKRHPVRPTEPLTFAEYYAALKFADQLSKAGLNGSQVIEASLIMRTVEHVVGPVNGRPSHGYNIRFLAQAKMQNSRTYMTQRDVFVAPHNPKIESRSSRADQQFYDL